jgi:hypothetical protein
MTTVQVTGGTRVTVGTAGPAGQGVPIGGTTGQVLAKASGTNYDTEWVTGGGGGGSTTWVGLTDTPGSITASGIVVGAAGGSSLEMVTALAISQVTGLQTALDAKAASSHTHTLADVTDAGTAAAAATGDFAAASHTVESHSDVAYGSPPEQDEQLVYNATSGRWENQTIGTSNLNDVSYSTLSSGDVLVWNGSVWLGAPFDAGNLATGSVPDARLPSSAVTQHEALLTITESQISDLGSYAAASHTHTMSEVTDLFADGVKNSIQVDATDLQLDGDSASPGGNKLYGTDGAGTKGWQSFPSVNALSDVVILSPATAQVLRFSAGAWRNESISRADISGLLDDIAGEFLSSSALTTGEAKLLRAVEAASSIVSASIVLNAADSMTVTVRKYTPSGGSLGAASALGTISTSSAQHNRSTGLAWSVSAGDILELEITAAPSSATQAVVTLGRASA